MFLLGDLICTKGLLGTFLSIALIFLYFARAFFFTQFLEQYGEMSMLDIKGADATKVILVVGIMTLHSFGEGSGVGVSFAGSKGLTQGILVTLAIAVHNIPEGLAVSMVLASRGVSPQNAMLWSVITSLPQVI